MPPAPPIFSTITCWRRISDRRALKIRATMSVEPPAAYGTTMVTGRVGQFCAAAVAAVATNTALAAIVLINDMVPPRFDRSSRAPRVRSRACERGALLHLDQ